CAHTGSARRTPRQRRAGRSRPLRSRRAVRRRPGGASFARAQHAVRGPQVPGPRAHDLRRRRMRLRPSQGQAAMVFGQTIHWASAGVSLVFGYLLGSIPFGLFFAWIAGAGDVRNIGSGSIGATNVLRTGKYWAAAATLIFDAAKGAAAVLIA